MTNIFLIIFSVCFFYLFFYNLNFDFKNNLKEKCVVKSNFFEINLNDPNQFQIVFLNNFKNDSNETKALNFVVNQIFEKQLNNTMKFTNFFELFQNVSQKFSKFGGNEIKNKNFFKKNYNFDNLKDDLIDIVIFENNNTILKNFFSSLIDKSFGYIDNKWKFKSCNSKIFEFFFIIIYKNGESLYLLPTYLKLFTNQKNKQIKLNFVQNKFILNKYQFKKILNNIE